jgi:S1-C subfamily serine protease
VIKKADGKRVWSWEEFRDAIRGKKPGQALKLTVLRDGEEKEVELKLAAPKPAGEESPQRP